MKLKVDTGFNREDLSISGVRLAPYTRAEVEVNVEEMEFLRVNDGGTFYALMRAVRYASSVVEQSRTEKKDPS